jgi:hypothetical protein
MKEIVINETGTSAFTIKFRDRSMIRIEGVIVIRKLTRADGGTDQTYDRKNVFSNSIRPTVFAPQQMPMRPNRSRIESAFSSGASLTRPRGG